MLNTYDLTRVGLYFQVMGFSPEQVASFIAVVGVLSVLAQVCTPHYTQNYPLLKNKCWNKKTAS